jgi:hypothetical protein
MSTDLSAISTTQPAHTSDVMRDTLAAFVQIMQDMQFKLSESHPANGMLSPFSPTTLVKQPVGMRRTNHNEFIPTLMQGLVIRRVRPAQIGPVPRMLDHLERKCTRLLLTTDATAVQLPQDNADLGPVNIHRVAVQVTLRSGDVHVLLDYWNKRSAFAAASAMTDPAETEPDAVKTDTKLSLLVWRAPRLVVPHTAAGVTPIRVIESCHVIPVTLLEAARFHHIPVEMRAAMISASLQAHIDAKLNALMDSRDRPVMVV